MILMIDIGIHIRIAFHFQDFNDFNVSENIKKREQT